MAEQNKRTTLTCCKQCSAVLPSMVTAAQRFFSSLSSVHSVFTAPARRTSLLALGNLCVSSSS